MEVADRLNQLSERLDEKHNENVERLTKIESELRHLDDAIGRLNRKLFGNGQPGVLQTMENRIGDVEKWCWRVSGAMAAVTVVINLILIMKKS